ncbi:hypothetical protein N9J15_07940 [Porticoccaceae bacterium]|nr:hypothetical protein [Porticoccaceae bacterium]
MAHNVKDTKKQGWVTLIALVVMAFAVSLGFAPLFELIGEGIAGEIIGSSFGAIFVIILTMFLLNKQTEIEQESKKSERLFDEKVNIYQKIFDICSDMLMDGKLSQDEINRLPFPLIKLQMLASEDVIIAFQEVFNELNRVYDVEGEVVTIQDSDKVEIYRLLSVFSNECRKDLEISDVPVDPEIQKMTVSTISSANKKSNDYTKYEFDGKKLPKNRYVYEVISNHILLNPELTLAEFQDGVLKRDFEGRSGVYETWKTYDEIKELHNSGKSGVFRYFVGKSGDVLNDNELVLRLKDCEICLSRSWAIGHMDVFRESMRSKGIRIE